MSNEKKRLQEYQKARNDGMYLACKIIQEDGIEGLKRRCDFVTKHKINTNLTRREMEEASTAMRGFLNEAHIVLWVSVLHDEFDFGAKRLNRAMDRFTQIYGSIDAGLASLLDYVELLQPKIEKLLKTEYIQDVDTIIKEAKER